MTWFWLTLAPFALAIVTYVIWTILSEMHEHSVYLYGRAVGRTGADDAIRVRLAIQNGEDVPLGSAEGETWSVRISIEDDAQFIRDPRVFAGPRPLRGRGGKGESVFWVDFKQLGASDTWVFECELEQGARAIALHILEMRNGELVKRRLRRLSASALRVDLGRGMESEAEVRGSAFLPSGAFGLSSIGAVVLVYAGVVALGSRQPGGFITSFHALDGLAVAVLVALGALMLRFVQRPAPPLIQGFRQESDVTMAPLASQNSTQASSPQM